MDTISRENNSMLPVAGVIIGGLGLIIAAYAALSVSKVKSHLADDYDPKIAQIDGIASTASQAQAAAGQASARIDGLQKSVQEAFDGVGASIGSIKEQIQKLQEAPKAGPGHHHGAASGPVVAGPGEYIVKGGDTGRKIANANGVSVHDLIAVNAGVDWKHLKIGQKIKLPEKKGEEAPAPAPAAPAPDQAPQQ